MSKPVLLADENVPALLVAALRGAGVQVEAVAETMPAVSDQVVIAHAVAQGCWLLTFDRDYGELVFARAAAAPPSIVYVRQQPRLPADLARDVMALLDRPDFATGHLVVMSDRKMRRRALPAMLPSAIPPSENGAA
jgi:predicted nuclease of predicted toxin-antitoxin system